MRISDWSSDVCSSDLVRSHVTFWTLADVLRPRSLSMKRPCRRNRHAACDCRARADGIEPSLDVGNGRPFQPMQREACDPWIGRDIGDRIVVRRQIRTLAEFLVENRVEPVRSEEHTSEIQSLMRISFAVFCLQKKMLKALKTTTKDIA